jgi:hypothetical protein
LDARYLTAVGECLVFHKIIGKTSDLTPANFKANIRAFQSAHGGLLADGELGELTAWALQAQRAEAGPQLASVPVPVDSVPGGDASVPLNLRADAAAAANTLFAAIRAKGGIVTSAGGFRALSVKPNAHQSARSMHYPGLAFDLAVTTGSFNPDKDPFVIERSGTTSGPGYWRVWVRAPGGDERTVKATIHSGAWANIKVTTKTVTGKFLSFTDLAKAHGFQPIGPRSGYLAPTQKAYMSSEWWHFQYEAALIPNFSQLGIEMLRVGGGSYTANGIAAANPPLWEERRAMFKQRWN